MFKTVVERPIKREHFSEQFTKLIKGLQKRDNAKSNSLL